MGAMQEVAGILNGSTYGMVEMLAQAHLVALGALVGMGIVARMMRRLTVPVK